MDENITNSEALYQVDLSSNPSIDDLQKMILAKMQEDEENEQNEGFDDFQSSEEFAGAIDLETASLEDAFSMLENEYFDISATEKKFVIAVNPDIVPFFDKMQPEKRTELINELLEVHIEKQKKLPERERLINFLKHSGVVFLTIVVGFPLVFFMTNASIEATVNSYRQVQSNFENLYKEKGGVKRKDMTKMQNLQY